MPRPSRKRFNFVEIFLRLDPIADDVAELKPLGDRVLIKVS